MNQRLKYVLSEFKDKFDGISEQHVYNHKPIAS